MFKLKPTNSFKWNVEVREPVDGRYNVYKFKAEFKLLSAEDQQDAQARGDADFLRVVLIGWEGIQDEDGNELVFSEIARESLIAHVPSRFATVQAYFSAVSGKASVRGN